ncbi:hypothetical protein BSFA1_80220 (plasmid) [Burkholderia sp. SFA1]|nr:hypothetical protein BYI23_E001200 [Burkholderia sp. YI23]BBQ02894.1 hypothetical protein BSFA1_80220 [Burkholderia sp. SFA1]
MRRILFSVITSLAVLSAPAFAAESALDVTDDLRVVAGQSPYGSLTGTATNTSDKVIARATIQFNLYDENNNLVGNAIAQASQVAPGERWIYTAPVPVPFHHAQVSKVTAM